MPKYVGNQEYLTPKRSFADKLAIASEGVAKGIQTYGQMKQMQEAKAVLADPKSTPIQQAMALASMGHEKIGSDVYKKSADQSLIADVESRLNQRLGRNITPTTNEQVNTVQPGAEGTGSLTQPGFSPAGPQQAARNATALNQPQLRDPPLRQPAPMMQNTPQGIPQSAPVPQVTPLDQAEAYDQAAQELAAAKPTVARFYENKANQIRKDVRADKKLAMDERQFAVNQNKAFNEETDKIQKSLPLKSQALDLAESAVSSGEVGPLSRNNLAKIFNRPELKTASGAALDLAIKTNLISNLSRVSAKGTNLWLEKQLLNAFASTGETQASNQTKLEALRAEKALDEAQVATRDRILNEDLEKYGAEQPYMGMRVNKELAPLEKQIMERASFRIRRIYEKEKGYQNMNAKWNKSVPSGTPLTPEMGLILLNKTGSPEKAASLAKQLGYTIYSAEKIGQYEQ